MLGAFGSGSVVELVVAMVVFVAVSAGAIFVLSRGRWLESLSGLFRVALTIFTTPFVFLRDALVIIRAAATVEQDYARTRIFMLFRYSRIQYLLIFVGTLLVLSGGMTASLMSLYPREELEVGRVLSERIRGLRADIDAATEQARQAGSPDQLRALEERRAQAERAYQSQAASNATFARNAPFNHFAIGQIASARSADAVTRLDGSVDGYMADSAWPTICAKPNGPRARHRAHRRSRKLGSARCATNCTTFRNGAVKSRCSIRR
jgi:hypothetical protein